jgi:hypothetical protein
MPIFMDTHKVPFTKEHLQELCASPRDEFGVAHVDLLFNKDANVCFCVLDAPNEEAVRKHHEKANVNCEWIIQVETAKNIVLTCNCTCSSNSNPDNLDCERTQNIHKI